MGGHGENDSDNKDSSLASAIPANVKVKKEPSKQKTEGKKQKRKISSKRLYRLILESPEYEIYGVPSGVGHRQIICGIVSSMSLGFIGLVLLGQFIQQGNDTLLIGGVLLSAILLGFTVGILLLSLVLDSRSFDKLTVNELGLGKEYRGRGLKGQPTRVLGHRALRWVDIDQIEMIRKGGRVDAFVVKGGSREVTFYRRLLCRGFPMRLFREHIPDFELWKVTCEPKRTYPYRYQRPTEGQNSN